MPFTLAHPAAVLPLRGVPYLRTTPLILGAMVPDAPYYVPASLARFMRETHTALGSVTSCLALGYLGLAALVLLRRPLTALLSARARFLCLSAVAPFTRRQPLEWLFAALAIVAGVWSHLLWDSFTHIDGWLVRAIPQLSLSVSALGYSGPLYHVLQYVSSAVGLLVLAVWYARLPVPRAAPPTPGATRSSVGPILLLIVAAAVLIGGVQAEQHYAHEAVIYPTIDVFLTRSIAWFALLYLVAGAVVTLERQGITAVR
ncbi:MAG TPA: DUF4184 family protein [Steroidobacteraceae bacterium]|nr:DUF4184 family protein [Steroidobacteraceae bacterium]